MIRKYAVDYFGTNGASGTRVIEAYDAKDALQQAEFDFSKCTDGNGRPTYWAQRVRPARRADSKRRAA